MCSLKQLFSLSGFLRKAPRMQCSVIGRTQYLVWLPGENGRATFFSKRAFPEAACVKSQHSVGAGEYGIEFTTGFIAGEFAWCADREAEG
jgi:hypothetical protein